VALPVDLTESVRAVTALRRAEEPVYVTQPATAQMLALSRAASYLREHPQHRTLAVRASRSAAPGAGRFVWPIKGVITGPFGEPRANGPHPGLDINGHIGDPVGAGAAGVVSLVGVPAGYEGYGLMVLIDHGNGLISIYAHLSQTNVGVGQQVTPGDLIGAVGCTGSCTGPHLHFEVRVNNTPIDPEPLLPPQ
jgi:murein DD-endopeptidase MepM/ murein hydrolase activator NlpD